MTTNLLDERQCTARSKRSGERCKRAAIVGGSVCSMHGGKAPAVRAKAEERVAEQAASVVVSKLVWSADAVPVTNAVAALQKLAGQLEAALGVLGGDMDLGKLESQPVRTAAWLRLVRESRQLLADMERLGIAQRAVELEAERVHLIVMAVGLVFEALELGPDQRELGTRVLLQALRAAEADGGAA